MFDETVREVKEELKREGRADKFLGAKVSFQVEPSGFVLLMDEER